MRPTNRQNTRRTPRRASSRALSVGTESACRSATSNASSSSRRPPVFGSSASANTLASGAKSLASPVRVSMSTAAR
ncbi:MAG TPA: hypothetical protein VFS00_18235 [Polyangiaceae bacterium]|nr:hypothetical protein [Polyangiaceae bacterium]